ncbi:hypothetical protein [Vibrio sp. AND4]|uniref:hypothetical protein n=1 Tax=Vibrio sp. AND4 TaxID=314289 RepID=UPI00015F05F9|nr:hypothetical protein [Vibrio sp. AND4]EDP58420.1 hypothetical protein AND4_04630 [Vibrio sp. AND4]
MKHLLITLLISFGAVSLTACSATIEKAQKNQEPEHHSISGTARINERQITFVAESNGCSKNDDFRLNIEQSSQTEAVITIVRDKADHCRKMPFLKTFTLELDEELQGKKLSITNATTNH